MPRAHPKSAATSEQRYRTILRQAVSEFDHENYSEAVGLARRAIRVIGEGNAVGALAVITDACIKGNLELSSIRRAIALCERRGFAEGAKTLRLEMVKRAEPVITITAPKSDDQAQPCI